jgi:hypothetical protein
MVKGRVPGSARCGAGCRGQRRDGSGGELRDCGGRGWAGAGWCGGAGAGKVGEDGLDGEGVRQQAGCALRTRGVGDLLTTSPTPGHAMKNVSRSAPSSGRHSHRLLSGRAFSRSWSPFSEAATMVCCRRSVPPSRLRTVARPGCGSSTGGTRPRWVSPCSEPGASAPTSCGRHDDEPTQSRLHLFAARPGRLPSPRRRSPVLSA